MSKNYGLAALKAYQLAANGMHPVQAWKTAAQEMWPDNYDAQIKGCPKSAFLGLAEDGRLLGVKPGQYTRSVNNKRYAKQALYFLQQDATLANEPKELWRKVMNGEKKAHNGQMNVVIELWIARRFVEQGAAG